MPVNVRFNFDRDAIRQHVRSASERALDRAGKEGKTIWEGIAPVSNDPRTKGGLRASWYARPVQRANDVVLQFGASAPYAKFVEFGTERMKAQSPLRRTAGQVVEVVRATLPEELAPS